MFMVTARNHIMQSTNSFLSVRYFCTDRRNSWISFPLICSSWTDNMKITHALGVGGVGHHLPMNNLLLGALPHCIHPKGDAEPLLLPSCSRSLPTQHRGHTQPHTVMHQGTQPLGAGLCGARRAAEALDLPIPQLPASREG